MPSPTRAGHGSAVEVLLAFLKLGLTSFGGPVAHLGYFHAEFVGRRRWLDERSYAELVALCQFLPGPASSQVGMALGLLRAGWAGAAMAWLGFTLPSALALIAFAYGIAGHPGLAASGAVHGLKVVAVAVVAQAVWTMARTLCPDRPRAALALLAALATLALPSAPGQLAVIVAAGLVGWRLLKLPPAPPGPQAVWRVPRAAGVAALALFAALLLGLPLLAAATGSPAWALVDGVYRAGALVFGGGHVVLPLLQASVVPSGAVDDAAFLAGYGAAQAVPGPLFTFAAYLGAVAQGPLAGWVGGLVFLVVIFVPAFLLVVGALPFWDTLRRRDAVRAAMAGVNAAVVGILLAALYDPVWTTAIGSRADFGLALAAFGLLAWGRVSPVIVVALGAAAGALLG
ncbi:chromate efflux transporter [Rubrivivax benzoatilyticus]|uniref:Chromate efflux transporter n=1 Tax=Rubrivivax benzoatilyticus TaxID=316997 RepID=A0ABX0HZ34_9BURK|nr:chromate efflux transporter [Rubrivivax benzoatilyticus]EGJ11416.1 chromate transporter [Rubrivivax benzoatilyticus JA2 = ATCC BAA-35]NHL00252.1 chromate efflux transporter [Rubrivivax benzoatilyticus]NHL26153.1 chromate efflux transporter [Rubrivivax benzoatilyticus]